MLARHVGGLVASVSSPTSVARLLILAFAHTSTKRVGAHVSSNVTGTLSRTRRRQGAPLTHRLSHRLTLVSDTRVSALSSFFRALVHQCFCLVSLSPGAGVLASDGRVCTLRRSILSRILRACCRENRPTFLSYTSLLSNKFRSDNFGSAVLSLCRFSYSVPFPRS